MADSAVRGLMATRTKAAPKKPAAEPKTNSGKVVQVIGPVLDVEFEPERLPELYNALVIDYPGDGTAPIHLVAEVQQHIGRNQVRGRGEDSHHHGADPQRGDGSRGTLGLLRRGRADARGK